ncbi:hypothetical protein O0L34_g13226 [Tuta absoluta]|nr:hypothetical protein O0L34_g13226 [Tuta absoluta]
MKSFACILLIAQAALLQTAYSFVISAPCGPSFINGPVVGSPFFNSPILSASSVLGAPTVLGAPSVIRAPGPVVSQTVVQPSSVASQLADTLSLLTVSSLLSDTLPLQAPYVLPVTSSYGCGCGYGYGNTILI